jgi:hypothetical protein
VRLNPNKCPLAEIIAASPKNYIIVLVLTFLAISAYEVSRELQAWSGARSPVWYGSTSRGHTNLRRRTGHIDTCKRPKQAEQVV